MSSKKPKKGLKKLRPPTEVEKEGIRKRKREQTLAKTQRLTSADFKDTDTGIFDAEHIEYIRELRDKARETRYATAQIPKPVEDDQEVRELTAGERRKRRRQAAVKPHKPIVKGLYAAREGKLFTIISKTMMGSDKPMPRVWYVILIPLLVVVLLMLLIIVFVGALIVVDFLQGGSRMSQGTPENNLESGKAWNYMISELGQEEADFLQACVNTLAVANPDMVQFGTTADGRSFMMYRFLGKLMG